MNLASYVENFDKHVIGLLKTKIKLKLELIFYWNLYHALEFHQSIIEMKKLIAQIHPSST